MQKKSHPFPIVGIGASAGGINALEGFFKGMPTGSGMAFVVVTHLNPERESLLHEIIARYTTMECHGGGGWHEGRAGHRLCHARGRCR